MGPTFCKTCGAFLIDGQKACVHCGTAIIAHAPERETVPPGPFVTPERTPDTLHDTGYPAPRFPDFGEPPRYSPSLKDPPYPWEKQSHHPDEPHESLGVGGYLTSLILIWLALLTPFAAFAFSVTGTWFTSVSWLGIPPALCALVVLIWALGGSKRRSRRKLARAALILLLVLSVACVAGYYTLLNLARQFWAEQTIPEYRYERPADYRPLPEATAGGPERIIVPDALW